MAIIETRNMAMAVLEISQTERFKTRNDRMNWLLDRFDMFMEKFFKEKDPLRQRELYSKIMALSEYIETTKGIIEREGAIGDPDVQRDLGLTDILLWSDDR
jgi:hypothetical protein